MRYIIGGLGAICIAVSTFQFLGYWDILLIAGINLIAFAAIEADRRDRALSVDRRPLDKGDAA